MFNFKDTFISALIKGQKESYNIEMRYKKLAINKISNLIANQKFKVVAKDEHQINNISYMLNVRPNKNQCAFDFWKKFVTELLDKGEVAIFYKFNDVVQEMYLAKDIKYKNNKVLGNDITACTITDGKNNETVKINNKNIILFKYNFKKDELNYMDIANRLDRAVKKLNRELTYKIRLMTTSGNITLKDSITKKEVDKDTYANRILEDLLTEEDSAFTLPETFQIQEVNADKKIKELTEVVQSISRELKEEVASAYNMPLSIIESKKIDKDSIEYELFITLAILPIMDIIETGLVDAFVGKKDYLEQKENIVQDKNILYVDLFKSAYAADKLFAIGYSHNEINEMAKRDKVPEKWADEHHVTKNYESTELKGGET